MARSNEVPTMVLGLKAPVEWFERIDRWCAEQQQAQGMTIRPSRPAAIRYIVHQFLLKQEQLATRRKGKRRTPKKAAKRT
jgi:hypothetical protein